MNALGIKSEKSYFDYHEGVEYSLDFHLKKLADLVCSKLINTMEKDGFYKVEVIKEDFYYSLMISGQKYIMIPLNDREITITTDSIDLAYGKQLLYETLLELDNSVSSIREVVNPDKMRDVVKEVVKDNPQSLLITKYIDSRLINMNLKSNTKDDIIKELVNIANNYGKRKKYVNRI